MHGFRYEYHCTACDLTFRCDAREDEVLCARCTSWARRQWGFNVVAAYGGGFNPSTGGYVANRADLASQLSRASDEASAPATVYDAHGEAHEVERPPARFVPVDVRDREALGVTSEGLDSTYDQLRRDGNDPAADRLRRFLD